MTDIVERLRDPGLWLGCLAFPIAMEAADEIERLCDEVATHKKWNTDIRHAALEEAARVADQYVDDPVNNAHGIAAAIRALKCPHNNR